MSNRLLIVVLSLLVATAATAWWLIRRSSATYPPVAARDFYTAIPGGPFEQGHSPPGTQFDNLGYTVLGDVRAAIVVSSRRPPSSDPYDNDLTLRIFILTSDAEARRLDDTERGDPVHARLPGSNEFAVVGLESIAWGRRFASPASLVAQVRRGNYVFRYGGRLHVNGLYPTEQAFLDDVKRLDAHALKVLDAAH